MGTVVELSEQFQSWVRWSRENLPVAGEIPKISTQDFKPPFFDDLPSVLSSVDSHRQELLACCVGLMAGSPSDVPTRFTALRLYSALAGLFGEDGECAETIRLWTAEQMGLDSQEFEMGRAGEEAYRQLAEQCERNADRLMKGFHQDLCLLVHQLKVEDVHAEWQFVRWEILNSYAIEDWDRANALYHKAEGEKLLDDAEMRAIRGQFKYLSVFGPRLDMKLSTLIWEPKLYGHDATMSVILFISGIRRTTGVNQYTGIGEDQFTGDEQAILCEASADLETALRKRLDFGPAYRSMLARCCLAIGHFHDAAEHYKQLLDWSGVSLPEKVKVLVYERLTESFRGANRTEEATGCLTKCAAEFPDLRGIHNRLADLYADEGKYELAYECLRREVELSPELEGELGVRIALALGAVHTALGHVEKFLEKNPNIATVIDSMLKSYWPSFLQLSEQARSEWRNGICEMYVFPLIVPENRDRCLENAAKHFAKVVELEVKSKVFQKFRQSVLEKAGTNDLLAVSSREAAWLKNLAKFLVSSGKLNLEKMTQILQSCSFSTHPAARLFQSWLKQSKPTLLINSRLLSDICKPRGQATHEEMAPKSAEMMANTCRTLLDILIADRGIEG